MKYFVLATCLVTFVVASAGASEMDMTPKMPKIKEPVVAAICSVVVSGAGQAYNEQYKKAGILLGADILGWGLLVASLEENEEGDLEVPDDNAAIAVTGLLIALGSRIYSIYDAATTADTINKRYRQAHLFQRETNLFTVGVDPTYSRKRLGARFALRF